MFLSFAISPFVRSIHTVYICLFTLSLFHREIIRTNRLYSRVLLEKFSVEICSYKKLKVKTLKHVYYVQLCVCSSQSCTVRALTADNVYKYYFA